MFIYTDTFSLRWSSILLAGVLIHETIFTVSSMLSSTHIHAECHGKSTRNNEKTVSIHDRHRTSYMRHLSVSIFIKTWNTNCSCSPKIALLVKWEKNRNFFLLRNSSPLKGSTKMGLVMTPFWDVVTVILHRLSVQGPDKPRSPVPQFASTPGPPSIELMSGWKQPESVNKGKLSSEPHLRFLLGNPYRKTKWIQLPRKNIDLINFPPPPIG